MAVQSADGTGVHYDGAVILLTLESIYVIQELKNCQSQSF